VWSSDKSVIIGLTPIGRVTILVLKMNRIEAINGSSKILVEIIPRNIYSLFSLLIINDLGFSMRKQNIYSAVAITKSFQEPD